MHVRPGKSFKHANQGGSASCPISYPAPRCSGTPDSLSCGHFLLREGHQARWSISSDHPIIPPG